MNSSPSVSKLILDFGGVIYTISHQKQQETFVKLGLDNFDELYSHAIQLPLFAQFECGKISGDEFRENIKTLLGNKFSDAQIDLAWNSILVGFPEDTVRFLELLSKHYTLYLLSNTNVIHYDVYINQFNKTFGYDFNTLFEKTYWSFKVGKRKPNKDIYDQLISECCITPKNTLFIDDTQLNTTTAEKAGIPSYWLKPGEHLQDIFNADLSLKL